MQGTEKDLMGKLETAEMVLVGTGEEFEAESSQDILPKAYEKLAQLLAGKNYFVITTGKDDLIMQSGLKVDRIVQPLLFEEDSDQMPPMWDKYTKWLQGTLNRNVLMRSLWHCLNNMLSLTTWMMPLWRMKRCLLLKWHAMWMSILSTL